MSDKSPWDSAPEEDWARAAKSAGGLPAPSPLAEGLAEHPGEAKSSSQTMMSLMTLAALIGMYLRRGAAGKLVEPEVLRDTSLSGSGLGDLYSKIGEEEK